MAACTQMQLCSFREARTTTTMQGPAGLPAAGKGCKGRMTCVYVSSQAVLVLSAKPGRVVTLPNVGILLRLPPAAGNMPPSEQTELRMLLVGEGGSFSTGPVVDLEPCVLRGAGANSPNTSTGSRPRCNAGRAQVYLRSRLAMPALVLSRAPCWVGIPRILVPQSTKPQHWSWWCYN